MILAVRYCIDAHADDARFGGCSPRCPACGLEARTYASEAAATAAQPACERALPGGDQGSIEPPARRFAVVVLQHVA